jgi:hypothetical protein
VIHQYSRKNVLAAARRLSPIFNMQAVGEREHLVQFYERDDYLIQSIGAYVAQGFIEGKAAVVIATRAHREALEQRLMLAGVDVLEYRSAGLYFTYDAEEMLSRFMVNGSPDPRRFRAVLGSLIAGATECGSGIRAFGEMVALLWARGQKDAAIELEILWNELAEQYSFALLCAYPIGGFTEAEKMRELRHICRAHHCVIPHENYCDPFLAPQLR